MFATPAFAEEVRPVAGLSALDWGVVIIFAAAMVGMGWWLGRDQHSAEDYYIGGGRMGPAVIGVSLFATLLSSISYLGIPSEMINKGPGILFAILALPIAFYIVGYWLIPRLMAKRVTSAYEMLEQRLGLGPRMITVSMFLALRLVWMGLMVNVASRAVVTMLGIGEQYINTVVIVCSVVAVAYTAIGGFRAVVFTDVVQFCVLTFGALLTLIIISVKMGGFGWFPTEWSPHWDSQPVFSVDPYVRVTIVGSIIEVVIWWVATAGADQTAIQRFMATGSAPRARRSFLYNVCADGGVLVLLGLVGFALLGYYSANPHLAAPGGLEEADTLFPHFIATGLPTGVRGLVVAAIFAAVMSSIDSGINSVTAVVQVDFIDRFRQNAADTTADAPEHSIGTARLLTVMIGIIIVVLNTLLLPHIDENIMGTTKKTVNLLVCPMFVVFVMALFVPRATSFGAMVAAIYAIGAAALISFWENITGDRALSFQWIGPCALVVGLVVGIPACRLPSPRQGAPYLLATLIAAAPLAVVFFMVYK
jgi:SSS family solute:Na+ symporter